MLKSNLRFVCPLKVSRGGAGYYRFGSVGSLSTDQGVNQIETHWKRFAVHFDDLPVGTLANLRVGFDLMGAGQVDIDNVEVFDRWFDENDAKAITQMLASTGPLLSRPESFDSCRRLLEGYWAKFLDEYIVTEDTGENFQPERTATATNREMPLQNRDAPVASSSRSEDSNSGKRKIPMFRRFRGFSPQRK